MLEIFCVKRIIRSGEANLYAVMFIYSEHKSRGRYSRNDRKD